MSINQLVNDQGLQWFIEEGTWAEKHFFGVEQVLFEGKTEFQNVAIIKTHQYGTILVIDGATQSSEKDEYVYHESLVHPAMTAHPDPRKVLVIGAGEGATIREILRHPGVERVVMVDIDEQLIALCQAHLPQWHQGAFQDPRVELVIQDARQYVDACAEMFDVVVIDLCDDMPEGAVAELYKPAFYDKVRTALAPGGVVIVQAMEFASLAYEQHIEVRRSLQAVFQHIQSYSCFVPSFWGDWGFILASDTMDFTGMTPSWVDQRLQERRLDSALRYYDGLTHQRMTTLPKDLRVAIESE